jgi:hypothetical protein
VRSRASRGRRRSRAPAFAIALETARARATRSRRDPFFRDMRIRKPLVSANGAVHRGPCLPGLRHLGP